MPKIVVNSAICKGCSLCVQICPQKIVAIKQALNEKGYHFAEQTDEQKCSGCKLCAIMCPEAAIEVYK